MMASICRMTTDRGHCAVRGQRHRPPREIGRSGGETVVTRW